MIKYMRIKRPTSKQPFPPSARRVFKGVIFDVYQWKQKMYDGSFDTFERMKRPDTASVIPVTKDGKIILCVQEQPGRKAYYSTLGGRIDAGESPLAAAKRELLEEAGFKSNDWALLDAVQPVTKIDWAVFTFVARGCGKVAKPHLDAGEKIDLLFVNFEKFIELYLKEDFGDKEIKERILEAKLDPKKMKKLKRLIFN